jgi:hypothetical protein
VLWVCRLDFSSIVSKFTVSVLVQHEVGLNVRHGVDYKRFTFCEANSIILGTVFCFISVKYNPYIESQIELTFLLNTSYCTNVWYRT